MLRKAADNDRPEKNPSRASWFTLAFAVIFLTPSMIGFVMKFCRIHPYVSGRRRRSVCDYADGELFAGQPGIPLLVALGRDQRSVSRHRAAETVMLQREMMLDENLKRTQGAPCGD